MDLNDKVGVENTSSPGRETIGIKDLKDFLRAYEIRQLKAEFTGRVTTLIIASLGLITALAWDDALRNIYHAIFGTEVSLQSKILYAAIITVIAVLTSIALGRLFIKSKRK